MKKQTNCKKCKYRKKKGKKYYCDQTGVDITEKVNDKDCPNK